MAFNVQLRLTSLSIRVEETKAGVFARFAQMRLCEKENPYGTIGQMGVPLFEKHVSFRAIFARSPSTSSSPQTAYNSLTPEFVAEATSVKNITRTCHGHES
jgi:hypothetical protein